jgi:hypothetical protein
MADDNPNPEPEEGLDQRVSSLETGQHSLSEKLDKILGIVGVGGGHDDEPTGQPDQPGGGTNIAHEIRQQLDERDAAARKKAEEDGLKSTVGELQTKLSELAEKPPAPMPRRIERLMGWS